MMGVCVLESHIQNHAWRYRLAIVWAMSSHHLRFIKKPSKHCFSYRLMRTGSNAQSVAEAALMMMLMLARRVGEAQRIFAERRIGEPVGTELSGKKLGIIGMGSIGRCLERAAGGLGMEVNDRRVHYRQHAQLEVDWSARM